MNIEVELVKTLISFGALGIYFYYGMRQSNQQNKTNNKIMETMVNSLIDTKKEVAEINKQTQTRLAEMQNRTQLALLQIMESIYDEKTLSNSTFSEYASLLNQKYTYMSISAILEELDRNGFSDIQRLNILKDNAIETLSISKNKFESSIMCLHYPLHKLKKFEMGFEITYRDFLEEFKDEVLNIDYDSDLRGDKNYAIFKNKIKNKIWSFNREIDDLIEMTSRG